MMALTLTQLPPEIVNAILGSLTPDDLVTLSLVNHWLRNFVQDNAALCRSIYLGYFDAPPTKVLDWEREITDFLRLKRICASDDPCKKSELPFVYATAKRILGHSARFEDTDGDTLFSHRSFRNAQLLSHLLDTKVNHMAFLNRSFLFERARNPRKPPRFPVTPVEEHQMSAELHSLFGNVTLRSYKDSGRVVDVYPYAASKVYDMRANTPQTLWGPFQADGSGRVDWEKIEAILVVLRYNIHRKNLHKFPILSKYWDTSFIGSWPASYIPMMRDARPNKSDPDPLDLKDPYGVTGTWMRIVCFLDYSDFFRFNFPFRDMVPEDSPRMPLVEGEELRLIIMKLRIKSIEPPGEDDHPNFPVVHFTGVSHAMDNPWDDNANSDLRGVCRTTKEGQVRWTTYSIFNGQDRWRSESIQLGGAKSGRGIIGNWFDNNYDPQGPCGPTAFWKLHEKKASDEDGAPIDTFPYLLASSISNGFNIVLNLNQPFGHFHTHEEEEDDDGNDENDENDSDYREEDDDEDMEDGEGDHGEEDLDFEAHINVEDNVLGNHLDLSHFEILPLLRSMFEEIAEHPQFHQHDHDHENADDATEEPGDGASG